MPEPSPADPVVILATCPDREVADAIAEMLVNRRLAGSVNVVPGVGSVYRWRGEIVRHDEVQLFAKTTNRRVQEAVAAIAAAHPYEVPGIVVLAIAGGWPAYLTWLAESTDPLPRG